MANHVVIPTGSNLLFGDVASAASSGHIRGPVTLSCSVYTATGDGTVFACSDAGVGRFQLAIGDMFHTSACTLRGGTVGLDGTYEVSLAVHGITNTLLTVDGHAWMTPCYFSAYVANPSLSQANGNYGAVAAPTLLIKAADNTNASGTGGSVVVQAGDGATDGTVELRDGSGTTRIKVCSDGDVVIGASANAGTEKLRVTGGAFLVDGTTGGVPVSGAGTRMFFAPAKGAFRAGMANGNEWDDANVGIYSVGLGPGVTASGSYAIAMGNSASASGSSSLCIGWGSAATATYSLAFGPGAVAYAYGSCAVGTGSGAHVRGSVAVSALNLAGSGQGISQGVIALVGRRTTGAAPVVLTADGGAPGSTNSLVLQDNRAWTGTVRVAARCYYSMTGSCVGDTAHWIIGFGVERRDGAGTITLLGTVRMDGGSENVPAWASGAGWSCRLEVYVDESLGALTITFTPAYSDEVGQRWDVHAVVEVSEVY